MPSNCDNFWLLAAFVNLSELLAALVPIHDRHRQVHKHKRVNIIIVQAVSGLSEAALSAVDRVNQFYDASESTHCLEKHFHSDQVERLVVDNEDSPLNFIWDKTVEFRNQNIRRLAG